MSGGKGLIGCIALALAIALGACAPATTEPSTTTAPTTTVSPQNTTTTAPAATTSTTDAVPPAWPAARRSHGMVSIGPGELLLVAGRTNNGTARTYLADTWVLSTADGTWEASGSLPTPRSQFALAGVGEGAVLMGGYVGDRFTYPGTWIWTDEASAGSWSRIEDPGPLTSRAGAVAAYDVESDVVVLFGGAERPRVAELPTNETWVLRNDRWTEVTPEPSPRPKSEGHPTLFELALVYDDVADLMVLLIGGDETWVYDVDTNSWEERSAPGLEADFMVAAAYDARLDRVVTYGGAPTGGSNETWLYDTDTDTWEQVVTATDPGFVGDHAMAYDPTTQRTYLFGGGADLLPLDGVGDLSDQLWVFDGEDWTLVGP